MVEIKTMLKKLAISIVIIFIVMVAIGAIYNSINPNSIENDQQEPVITEEEVYQRLMNREIFFEYDYIKISEILDSAVDFWNLMGGNAYGYGGYANHIQGNTWEVGVYINADGDVTKYSWEYNVETNKEIPLSIAAKELYP